MTPVHVIGGGLAGSEAAWQLARAGVPVVIHEMRPHRATDAHLTDGLAELVCSNSFRSDDAEGSAIGLLHEEMRRAGSLILGAGDANRVPAVWRPGRRPGRLLAGCRSGAPGRAPGHRGAPGNCRPSPARVGQRDHRHRTADLTRPRHRHRGAHRRGPPSPSSTPSRP